MRNITIERNVYSATLQFLRADLCNKPINFFDYRSIRICIGPVLRWICRNLLISHCALAHALNISAALLKLNTH